MLCELARKEEDKRREVDGLAQEMARKEFEHKQEMEQVLETNRLMLAKLNENTVPCG